ncbi:aminotransferase class V-fold PLP-dependent enzyme [Erysipelothrix urinaevulpis]|uniref:aminotransferase class V-fold PLP-dependent enzyme n=1 Tax=Erysipelothrix urinaevulpis TaxID=2683717 RepID=UPI00135684EC|nr:cysteine desulfurase [Erysipelothrix urinaevulpis]
MDNLRKDFPFLKNNPELAYFDNAATSLKPQQVIDEVSYYYEHLGANIHRGDYKLSHKVSGLFDQTRIDVACFINADSNEVVFTSGASESLNLVAMGFASQALSKGDVILLNETEHASNLLPWYALAQQFDFVIEFIETDEHGEIQVDNLKKALHDKVKLVSIAHASNVLGYIRDIQTMSHLVHENQAYLVVDGAQTVGHIEVDVKALDVDFFAFSAHKMLGPTGVGVLYGKAELLKQTQPIFFGGGSNVDFDTKGTMTLKEAPYKFESGTPNIEGVLGFRKAIEYYNEKGISTIESLNSQLYEYAYLHLSKLDNVVIYNPNSDLSIISFNVKGIFAQDVAQYLDSFDIAVRTGEHCAKAFDPTMKKSKTIRASLLFYNTKEEVDRLVEALRDITLEKCIDLYI